MQVTNLIMNGKKWVNPTSNIVKMALNMNIESRNPQMVKVFKNIKPVSSDVFTLSNKNSEVNLIRRFLEKHSKSIL